MQIANFILISKLTFYSQLSCERKVEKKVHLLDLLSAFLIYNRLNSFHIKCFYKRKQVLLGSIGVNCNLADEKLLKATSKGNSGSFGLCTPQSRGPPPLSPPPKQLWSNYHFLFRENLFLLRIPWYRKIID